MLKIVLKFWLDKVKKFVVECLDKSFEKLEMVMIIGGMSLLLIVVDVLYEVLLMGLFRLENDVFNFVCEGLVI